MDNTERKTAEWELTQEIRGAHEYVYEYYICSECKERALSTGGYEDEQVLSNYCPNCGARMNTD